MGAEEVIVLLQPLLESRGRAVGISTLRFLMGRLGMGVIPNDGTPSVPGLDMEGTPLGAFSAEPWWTMAGLKLTRTGGNGLRLAMTSAGMGK